MAGDGDPPVRAAEPHVPAQLADLLAGWLPGQRWFAGKGREHSVGRLERLGDLTTWPYRSSVFLAHVHYPAGDTETYQLPLVERPAPVGHLAHALLGELVDARTDRVSWWYDALHDDEVTGAWLRHIASAARRGEVAFHHAPSPPPPAAGGEPAPGPAGRRRRPDRRHGPAPSRVLTAEQSNTSLVFGDEVILKVFRRLLAGTNPDIEVHQALARAGAHQHVARLLGHVSARWRAEPDGWVGGSLAMLQEYLRPATDGWQLATTSLRRRHPAATRHSDLPPGDAGNDFAAEAGRLGVATARMHADLARALPTGVLTGADLARIAAGMRRRLARAVEAVPQLAEHAAALHRIYDDLQAGGAGMRVQRVHGDYHLGQVVRTGQRWVVLDFEGEPASPLAERIALDSPLRDVAGMLRSIDYAAGHLSADQPVAGCPPQRGRARQAGAWVIRNQAAFCAGYARGSGRDPRDEPALLRAYEAHKAVYEAVYEARNRPAWLPIPLTALARLARAAAAAPATVTGRSPVTDR